MDNAQIMAAPFAIALRPAYSRYGQVSHAAYYRGLNDFGKDC
jgi:hypothetical protein